MKLQTSWIGYWTQVLLKNHSLKQLLDEMNSLESPYVRLPVWGVDNKEYFEGWYLAWSVVIALQDSSNNPVW